MNIMMKNRCIYFNMSERESLLGIIQSFKIKHDYVLISSSPAKGTVDKTLVTEMTLFTSLSVVSQVFLESDDGCMAASDQS